MRIGCLQFAPRVGDVDNNLNRADAVLNRSQDLEGLDLLVLPELAFSGYKFKSLAEISPFLEPSGSGISALWARTIALKHNCNVVVGYPEKVDVAPKWPTSPEFYNSAIMINADGETIANYRKSFLYAVDETWALEGQDGFFEGCVDGLGNVAMGICMDINPYKLEAPWHAFEFAFHVLEVEANLVIVTMAWLAGEQSHTYTQLSQEPDLDTLVYWIQRLEPIIRADSDEEVIVVFCNRTGIEDDAIYAGTSSVIGIRNGEVGLYGILGRGVKEVLVVDTDRMPICKLVNGNAPINAERTTARQSKTVQPTQQAQSTRSIQPTQPTKTTRSTNKDQPSTQVQRKSSIYQPPLLKQNDYSSSFPSDKVGESSTGAKNKARNPTPIARNVFETWDFLADRPPASSLPSVLSISDVASTRFSVPKLGLQIPSDAHTQPGHRAPGNTHSVSKASDPAEEIPTPTAPSPTPSTLRPNFSFLDKSHRVAAGGSIIPPSVNMKSGASVVTINRTDSPVTPPTRLSGKDQACHQISISEGPPSPPTDSMSGLSKAYTISQKTKDSAYSAKLFEAESNLKAAKAAEVAKALRAAGAPEIHENETTQSNQNSVLNKDFDSTIAEQTHFNSLVDASRYTTALQDTLAEQSEATKENDRSTLSSPNAKHDLFESFISVDLQRELDQALESMKPPSPTSVPARPPSTKSRNASVSRPHSASGFHHLRSMSLSRSSIPIMASPSIFQAEQDLDRRHQPSAMYFRPASIMSGAAETSTPLQNRKNTSLGPVESAHDNAKTLPLPETRRNSSFQNFEDALTKAAAESNGGRPPSRGRQPFTKNKPTNATSDSPWRSHRVAGAESIPRQASGSRFTGVGDRAGANESPFRGRAASSTSSASWLFESPPLSFMPQNPLQPDDEIVAMISLINDNCPMHNGTRTPLQHGQGHVIQHSQDVIGSQQYQQQQDGQNPTGVSVTPSSLQFQTVRSPAGQEETTGTPSQQHVYEVILPPHIRELVESMSDPELRNRSPLREFIRNRGTPKIDPPTPTAMDFKPQEDIDATVAPAKA